MALDLDKIAPQIEGMVEKLAEGSEEKRRHCDIALARLRDPELDVARLKGKIEACIGRTTWLVAGLHKGLGGHYPPPPVPGDFTVIATDGSHIDVDRHRRARCYLINTGAVTLTYGEHPDATLESFPRLYSSDEDMVIAPPEGESGREQIVEGALLGIRRTVEECRKLVELVSKLPSSSPALALLDGSLVLWSLGGGETPGFVVQALLHRGFLSCMDEMRKAACRNLAVASYVSFPRSADVVNSLRVAICKHEIPDCDRYCDGLKLGKRDCDMVAGVQDRELFYDLLGEGERSELFISTSSIVRNHYGENKVYFFYLKLEDEIARVEVPEWVALDENRLGLTHSLILDQCRRGQGYPVALSEAHEQAVITTADRENFWLVAESYLSHRGLPTFGSAKDMSKRTRWV